MYPKLRSKGVAYICIDGARSARSHHITYINMTGDGEVKKRFENSVRFDTVLTCEPDVQPGFEFPVILQKWQVIEVKIIHAIVSFH